MVILDGAETTCLIDHGACKGSGPGCGFDPGIEPAQWAHSTKWIGGKGYGALRLHDAPGPDTVCAEL